MNEKNDQSKLVPAPVNDIGAVKKRVKIFQCGGTGLRLTDADATKFNNAVQAFQTALGRRV